MRRRRTNRGTWMPTLGTTYNNGANHYHNTALRIDAIQPQVDNSLIALNNADQTVFPLVPDYTEQQDDNAGGTGQTLADLVQGQEWFLNRIVGKVHLGLINGPGGTTANAWPNAVVKLGFFVARAIDEAQQNIDLQTAEYDPYEVNNVQNPWIFQRSWMMSTFGLVSGPFPFSTDGYGSMSDGPHLDIKTKRRIRREERLWGVIRVMGFASGATIVSGAQVVQPKVIGVLDYRCFGGLRKAKNVSRF